MRDSIGFILNGTPVSVTGDDAFMSLSDFLRDRRRLTGTKVVCAEGDCGACTLLVASPLGPQAGRFKSVNSCISFVFQMDGHQLVTIEGLQKGAELHPCQQSMVDCFGAQCGFCTPGFVASLAYLAESAKTEGFTITEKRARNYLTGNLCRCTGYEPILKAGETIDLAKTELLSERYDSAAKAKQAAPWLKVPVKVTSGQREIFLPATLAEAIEYKKAYPEAKLVSGATDLGVLINKNRLDWVRVISLQNIAELHEIRVSATSVTVGARVTYDQIEESLGARYPELGRMLHIFASPQIKHRATLVGNLVNGSPIADGIPFLMAADAVVKIEGAQPRAVPVSKFFLGYKTLDLAATEIVTGVEIPLMPGETCLYKASVRKDLDISAVTFASCYRLDGNKIGEASIVVGGVGPSVMKVPAVEDFLRGKDWSRANFEQAAELLRRSIKPLSDLRGSAGYRSKVAGNFVMKMYYEEGAKHGLAKMEDIEL